MLREQQIQEVLKKSGFNLYSKWHLYNYLHEQYFLSICRVCKVWYNVYQQCSIQVWIINNLNIAIIGQLYQKLSKYVLFERWSDRMAWQRDHPKWTLGQRHRWALVHLEEFESAESAERTLSGHDENVEVLPYRFMWLWGETDYVSSYDMCWLCPQWGTVQDSPPVAALNTSVLNNVHSYAYALK